MLAVQPQFKTREETCIGVEQSIGIAHRGADVAVTVRHDEGVAALERAARTRRGAGRRNIERSVARQIDALRFLLRETLE